jgi:hypothetical protein
MFKYRLTRLNPLRAKSGKASMPVTFEVEALCEKDARNNASDEFSEMVEGARLCLWEANPSCPWKNPFFVECHIA